MPQGIFAGWGKQSAYATAVAPTKFGRCYDDTTVDHRRPADGVTYLDTLDPGRIQYREKEFAEGLLAPVSVYDGNGTLYEAALGTLTTTGSGPYTHTFTLADTLPANGLSVEVHYGFPQATKESKLGVGMFAVGYAAEFRASEPVRERWTLRGRNVQMFSKSTETVPAYDNEEIISAHVALTIDTVSTTVVEGVTINLDNNPKTPRALLDGSAYIAEFKRGGRRTITGELSKEWENEDIMQDFLSGTDAELIVTATGTGNRSMVWKLAKIRYLGELSEELTESETVMQTIPFTALDDATDGALKITMTNDTASGL